MSSHSLTTATPTRSTSTSATTPVSIALRSQKRVTATSVIEPATMSSRAVAPISRNRKRRRRASTAQGLRAPRTDPRGGLGLGARRDDARLVGEREAEVSVGGGNGLGGLTVRLALPSGR